MNLKKKDNFKEEFKEKDLFKIDDEEENNADDDNDNENNEDEAEESQFSQNLKKLEWKTDSNLYTSAIQVKEINII